MISSLLFLLFIFISIEYRIELGFLSIALAEPVALLFSATILAPPILQKRLQGLRDIFKPVQQEPLLLLFLFISCWALLIRPWAMDWKHGLSDVRDWLIPAITFLAMMNLDSRQWRKWQKWLQIFLVIVYLTSLLGIYQHFTNSARPFATDSSVYKREIDLFDEDAILERASFAVGFFAHPNQFGLYLSVGLMMSIGWMLRQKPHWTKYILLSPIVIAIYCTYAKTSLLATAFALGLLAVHLIAKSNKQFLWIMTIGMIGGLLLLAVTVPFLPPSLFGDFKMAYRLMGNSTRDHLSKPLDLIVW